MLNKNNYLIMKIRMFISSYFPLYVILLVLNFELYNDKHKLLNIIKFVNVKQSLFCIILMFFIIFSLLSLFEIKNTKGCELHKFNSIETPDDTIISYMMTYIIPLLSNDFLEPKTLTANIIIFFIVGFMYVKLNLVYLNPLWLMGGYYMYKCDNGITIVANISYSDIKQLEGVELNSTFIAGKIYLIRKSDNNI